MLTELKILSYHKFVDKPDDYRFSRTYNQFAHDIDKKIYDLITIDDGMKCMIKACDMLKRSNRRAKLFICTSLIGLEGYCTWDEVRTLSRWHDIENHSNLHLKHTEQSYEWQYGQIKTAQQILTHEIGRAPRYFVAPYNQYNTETDMIAEELGLICMKGRENILNISK